MLSGGAKVSVQTGQKNEQIVTILSIADFVGISAVMNNHPYHKSARVLSEKATVLFIEKEAFLGFCSCKSDFGAKFVALHVSSGVCENVIQRIPYW